MAFGAWSQVFDPEVWSASQWGTKYYALRIYYRYRQDVAANVTQFELQGFRFYTLTSARGIHAATLHGYFSVNYIDQGYKTVRNTMPSPPGNVYLPYNMTVDVPHNQDGTYNSNLYLAWRFYVTGASDSIQPNIQTSQRVNPNIPKIPRVSSASVSTGTVTMGNKQTIKIGRQTTSYTHTLYYKFANQSNWTQIASGVNADSYEWTVPTGLASSIPNATSGTCQILVRTMSGSTQIGDSITSFTANVPTNVVPSISSVSVVETTANLATQFGAFIQSKSGYKCTISASGASGSTIKTYRVEMGGKSASGSGNVLNLPAMGSSGSLTLKTTVTDSRGRTATKSQTVNVLAYSGASCSLTVARCNADGILDDEGERVKVTYKFSITPLNNKNTRKLEIQYLNGSTWTTLYTKIDAYSQENTFTTDEGVLFSVDNSYRFRAICSDYFGSVTVERTVDTSFSLIDLGSDGKSIAFGGVARDDGSLHSDIPSYFNKGLYVPIGPDAIGSDGVPRGGAVINQGSVQSFCTNSKSYIGSVQTGEAWYNVISVRHRNGASDGNSFGMRIYAKMQTDESLYWSKQYSGSWNKDKEILDSSNYTKYTRPYNHHTAEGTTGTSGWIKILRFTVKGNYINTPLKITLTQRSKYQFTDLYLYFAPVANTDPNLNKFLWSGQSMSCRMTKVATSIWELYVQKTEAWDKVDIIEVDVPARLQSLVSVENRDELVSTVGGSNITAPTWSQLDNIYPVGSVVWLQDGLNPNTLYGGTWAEERVAFGSTYNSDQMIDANGGTPSNGTNVQTYQWNGSLAQKWVTELSPQGTSTSRYYIKPWIRTA